MKPLMFNQSSTEKHSFGENGTTLRDQFLPVGKTKVIYTIPDTISSLLKGEVIIIAERENIAVGVSIQGGETRGVEQPETEVAIRGPREGFNENLQTNIGLIRRKIRSQNLKMETMTIGEVTQTAIVITYIHGIAEESLINEVKNRVKQIKVDGIFDSGYIEQFIEDCPFSPFPQFLTTERPDTLAAGLLEGQIAILQEGTPFAISGPMTFWGFMQTGEDHFERVIYSNLIRCIRFIFLFMALYLPSIYVALTTYHQQMIPTNLLLTVAAAREAIPFPALVEALMMEIMFEGLREAGVRLPKAIGQAVSIVGALVIGQAAVQAGIISAPMVIVVSLTGIASFIIPRFNFSAPIRILRFPILILAGTLGLYGITLGMVGMLIHLLSIRSLGVPYLTPLAPMKINGLKGSIFRLPIWFMHNKFIWTRRRF